MGPCGVHEPFAASVQKTAANQMRLRGSDARSGTICTAGVVLAKKVGRSEGTRRARGKVASMGVLNDA